MKAKSGTSKPQVGDLVSVKGGSLTWELDGVKFNMTGGMRASLVRNAGWAKIRTSAPAAQVVGVA